jgi:PAS domain S-box-containing protein
MARARTSPRKADRRRESGPRAGGARDGGARRPAHDAAARAKSECQKAVEALEVYKAEALQQHHELIESQQALEESRDRYASLFDYAPVALLSVRRNGIIMDINIRGAEMLESTRSRVLGLPLLSFVLRDDHRLFLSHMLQCRREHNTVNTEVRLRTRMGSVVPVMLSAWMTPSLLRPEYEFRTAIMDLSERRRAAEREAEYQRDLRSLASELSLAEERERRRIAIEIHDNLSQNLALIKMKLAMLAQKSQVREARDGLAEAVALLDPVLERTRSLTFELSPPVLYELGLDEALEWLADRMAELHRLPVKYERARQTVPGAPPVPHDLAVLLFQAVRELLMNVVKHAQALHVTVRSARADGTVVVSVRDDGKGFHPAPSAGGRNGDGAAARRDDLHGFGLFSIRTRLEHLGGKMTVRSRVGHGTEITVVVPVQPAETPQKSDEADNPDMRPMERGYNRPGTSHGHPRADMRQGVADPGREPTRPPGPPKRSKS